MFDPIYHFTPLDAFTEGNRALNLWLSSSQSKSEKLAHRGILDHPNLFNGDGEGKRHP